VIHQNVGDVREGKNHELHVAPRRLARGQEDLDAVELPDAGVVAAALGNPQFVTVGEVTGRRDVEVPVVAVQVERNRVTGVATDRGPIAAPVVDDAAGAWSALIGRMTDLRIAVVPTRHQLFVTEPVPGFTAAHPIVRFMDVMVYPRPCDGGVMLGGYEPAPPMQAPLALDADFSVENLRLDLAALEDLARKGTDVMPLFAQTPVRLHRGGLPTMTADGNPLVGPLPGLTGFYRLSGCCVGGLAKSPALGRTPAHWILHGAPNEDLAAAAPDRFRERFSDARELVEACRWQYANHYDKAARP